MSATVDPLTELLKQPQANLAEAALNLATVEYPELDVEAYLERLDEMAAELEARLPEDLPTHDKIVALNRYLFEEQGFQPNREHYYDPRNNFLNEVIDRKAGIPITLSIVYIEIGRCLGLEFQAVSFPGHFLVKLNVDNGSVVLDPYSGGVPLTEADLQKLLVEVFGAGKVPEVPLQQLLVQATPTEVVVRLLRNLKGVYLKENEFHKALAMADRIVRLDPALATEWRDRGLIYLQLECFRAALADLERYVEMDPQAPDAAVVKEEIVELQRLVAHLN